MSLGDESSQTRNAGGDWVLIAVVDADREDELFGLKVDMRVTGDQISDVVEVAAAVAKNLDVRGGVLDSC